MHFERLMKMTNDNKKPWEWTDDEPTDEELLAIEMEDASYLFHDGEEIDDEYEDVVLGFIDDEPIEYSEAEVLAIDTLGQYSFEEILDFNDITEHETLALLYIRGDIGIPIVIEDEDSEAEQDLQEEEE